MSNLLVGACRGLSRLVEASFVEASCGGFLLSLRYRDLVTEASEASCVEATSQLVVLKAFADVNNHISANPLRLIATGMRTFESVW